jgi:hypothetical protein
MEKSLSPIHSNDPFIYTSDSTISVNENIENSEITESRSEIEDNMILDEEDNYEENDLNDILEENIFITSILAKKKIYNDLFYKVILSDGTKALLRSSDIPENIIQLFKKK